MIQCDECNGSGVVNRGMEEEHQCMFCGGIGFVPSRESAEEGSVLNT